MGEVPLDDCTTPSVEPIDVSLLVVSLFECESVMGLDAARNSGVVGVCNNVVAREWVMVWERDGVDGSVGVSCLCSDGVGACTCTSSLILSGDVAGSCVVGDGKPSLGVGSCDRSFEVVNDDE